MRLSQFWAADALVARRNKLLSLLASNVGVTLGGTYQDDTIVELVKPVVHAELRARIAAIDADLKALGIKIDV